ncbi:putative polymerase acidic [Steelhead trout orthomyxovirus-1]|uniref:Polymerase acidic n=1 Tax=Steelhead trout orthomyxovirus-1 TaxID=1954186 RepID=A0A1Q1MMD8_9ORTO|nr:putative polymerase acidic [Steelhead trout orthomyxovirus-1]
MNLKDIPETEEVFQSDVRHCLFCTFFCNKRTMGEEGEDRFINLELMEPYEAKALQMKYEGEWGREPSSTTDILDLQDKELIEITFTSGSLEVARARKMKKQKNSVIVVISENLDIFLCDKEEYREVVKEGMDNLRAIMVQYGISFILNAKGGLKEALSMNLPEINLQFRSHMDSVKAKRDIKEALAKIAKQPLSFSTKGAFETNRENKGTTVEIWLDPMFVKTKGPIMPNGPYGEMMKQMIDSIGEIKGNGKSMEETLVSWIKGKKFRIWEGECVASSEEQFKEFGEGKKKQPSTVKQLEEKGDMRFKKQTGEGHKHRKFKGLSKEWKQLIEDVLTGGDEEIEAVMESAVRRLNMIGSTSMALHRGVAQRITRPLYDERTGEMWGFIMKWKSLAHDTKKDGNCMMIIFANHPSRESENECWLEINGNKIPFYIMNHKTRGDWSATQAIMCQSRVWVDENGGKDPEVRKRRVEGLSPITGTITSGFVHNFIHLDEMYHISNCFKGSAVQEALSSYIRKLGSQVKMKNMNKVYGAVMGFGKMCEDINETVEKAVTATDFRCAVMCSVLSRRLTIK